MLTHILNAFIGVTRAGFGKRKDISMVEFSTFPVAEQSAYKTRNVQTGEIVDVAASKTVKFKAGKTLKELVK